MIKHLEKNENFESLTKEKCLIDFYADWCGPCKMMGALLEEIQDELSIPVIKVNTDSHQELSAKMGVMSIPTLVVMEGSKEVKRSIGYMSKEDLIEFVK